jgi:ankyrin repeat protein
MRLLNRDIMKDKVADVNARGLDQWTALHFAAKNGHLQITKELLKMPGVEFDALSSIKRTPLHIACLNGRQEVAKVLIEKGAKVNAQDDDRSTPLHLAAEFGKTDTAAYLILEAKADCGLRNRYGYTPSDISGNLEIR